MVLTLPRILKFISGGAEALLGIPIIGETIVITTNSGVLIIMFIFHLMTFLIARNEGGSVFGSLVGMVASIVGVFAFAGMLMHMAAALVLLVNASIRET
ncbi:hypothetical protein [Virgibacillus siamensis]|uniref:hypothetical protein n=1 Tax=Virgibacillus siamensis TaxID=480071 RepID=UPI001FEB0F9E|nr:hypothetical protein [Virgibacillus siamensis]